MSISAYGVRSIIDSLDIVLPNNYHVIETMVKPYNELGLNNLFSHTTYWYSHHRLEIYNPTSATANLPKNLKIEITYVLNWKKDN